MTEKKKVCKGGGCPNGCPISTDLNGDITKIKESIIKINKDICWMKEIINDTKKRMEKMDKRMWGIVIGVLFTLLAVIIELVIRT